MKTKFAIGCLVQWFECDVIEEYVDSLKDAIAEYDGQVIVDFTIVGNQDLEKCISDEQHRKCTDKIESICNFGTVRYTDDLHTIADYRKGFNEWARRDSLLSLFLYLSLKDSPKKIITI